MVKDERKKKVFFFVYHQMARVWFFLLLPASRVGLTVFLMTDEHRQYNAMQRFCSTSKELKLKTVYYPFPLFVVICKQMVYS